MLNKFKFGIVGLIGLIVGIVISNATMAFAGTGGALKIMLNGRYLDNIEALIINDTTYVPIRKLAEAQNLDVTWDPERWQVNLYNKGVSSDKAPTDLPLEQNKTTNQQPTTSNTTTPTATNPPTTKAESITPPTPAPTTTTEQKTETKPQIQETRIDGMRAIITDGVTYFNARDYAIILEKNGGGITVDSKAKTITIAYGKETTTISYSDTKIYNGLTYINVKYYKK